MQGESHYLPKDSKLNDSAIQKKIKNYIDYRTLRGLPCIKSNFAEFCLFRGFNEECLECMEGKK
jgi:hypothetical protein